MKKLFTFFICLGAAMVLQAQTVTLPSGGGTSGSPLQISSLETKTSSISTSVDKITSQKHYEDGNYSKLLLQMLATSTFSGTGNWSEPGRWSNGVPDASTDVIIDGTCTVGGDYVVASMTINSGAVVSIDPGKVLTVSGTLTNNADTTGLVLESDATGTGMLMNNSTGVHATIQQYLKKDQWHFMGIPVRYVSDANNVYHNCYLAWIDESNAYSGLESGWQYLRAGDPLIALHGYTVQYNLATSNNDTTITFSGILNTGVQDTTFDSETEGWNFVSNPYPVTMDWDASSGKELFRTNDAFYVWNPDLNSGLGNYGSYGSYVSGGSTNGQTQYIAPMQGFFVEVWHVIAGITFNDNMKVTNKVAFKSATVEPQIKLAVTSNGINYDEMLLRVKEGATTSFDHNYDAHKLKALASKQPQLYSVLDGQEYSINSIPEITENLCIPLEVIIKTTGQQTLVLKELKNYNYGYPIRLLDERGNHLKDLRTGDYTFNATAGETVKLNLAFNSATQSIDPTKTSDISLCADGQNLIIKGLDNVQSAIKIVNVNGQVIFNDNVTTTMLTIPIARQGIYIVNIIGKNGELFNKKTVVTF